MKNIISCCLLLLSVQAFAQKSGGYLVELSGDSLKGFLFYKNIDQVEFASSVDGPRKIYTSQEVRSFGFNNNRHYHAISVNNTPHFGRLILTGKATLYSVGHDYHIVKKDDTALPIGVKTKRVTTTGGEFIAEDKSSIAALQQLFSDCQSQDLKLDEIVLMDKSFAYQQNVIEKAVARYNDCTGSHSETINVVKKKKERDHQSAFSVALFAGKVVPMLQIHERSPFFSTSTLKDKRSYSFGVNAMYFFPRAKWLAVTSGVVYEDMFMEGDWYYQDYPMHSELQLRGFKVPLALRFQHPIGKVGLYLKAGAQAYFGRDSNHFYSREEMGYQIPFPVDNFYVAPILGGGVEYRIRKVNLFFDATYDAGGMVVAPYYTYVSIFNQSFTFSTGVRF